MHFGVGVPVKRFPVRPVNKRGVNCFNNNTTCSEGLIESHPLQASRSELRVFACACVFVPVCVCVRVCVVYVDV